MSKKINPEDTNSKYPYENPERFGFGIASPNKSYVGQLGDILPWEKPEDIKVYTKEELKKNYRRGT